VSIDIAYYGSGYGYIWCVAIINDSLYYWDPVTDDVYLGATLGVIS
jgi:hypothetical protein